MDKVGKDVLDTLMQDTLMLLTKPKKNALLYIYFDSSIYLLTHNI